MPLMEIEPCTTVGCSNWGTLVIDANIVIYTLAASVEVVKESEPDNDWRKRLPSIETVFGQCLEKIGKCSHNGKLHCSEYVFREELDVEGLSIGTRPAGKSNSIYDKGQLTGLRKVLRSEFDNPIITNKDEIEGLISIIKEKGIDMLDRDVSLLVAACKVGTSGIPTIIISQDNHFEDSIQILANMRSCSIQGKCYETSNIIWRTYLGYITEAHDRCCISSAVYTKLYNAWCFSIPERISGGKQRLAQRLKEQFIITLPIMEKSIEYKGRG